MCFKWFVVAVTDISKKKKKKRKKLRKIEKEETGQTGIYSWKHLISICEMDVSCLVFVLVVAYIQVPGSCMHLM